MRVRIRLHARSLLEICRIVRKIFFHRFRKLLKNIFFFFHDARKSRLES